MDRNTLSRVLAAFMTVLLLTATPGVAENVAETDVSEAALIEAVQASDEAPEAGVAEATGMLGELESPFPEAPAQPEATSAPEEGEAVAQNAVPAQIKLGEKMKYTLDAKPLAPGKKITYKTNKSSVATVSSKGVVTAKKKGTAKIRCYKGKTLLATCVVKVIAGPSKVSLGMSSITIGKTESVQLVPTIPKGTMTSFSWSSKRKSVVSVSKDGVITGKKTGTTTITVKTANGRTKTLTVNVKKKPDTVTLNKASASLKVGKTLKLKASLSTDTASNTILWTSSDDQIATVDASGKVTAVSEGLATITVMTYNGKKATCTVTVTSAETPPPYIEDDSVSYRALLIGEVDFDPVCLRNQGDVLRMESMLESVRGLYGGAYSIVKKYDLNRRGILNAIDSTFADADENDVSLFFIATHGDVIYSGVDAGSLLLSSGDEMLLRDLADTLAAIPGKVIVILGSCGSGAAVYDEYGDDENGLASIQNAAKTFDQAVVKAFSRVDPGMVVEVKPNAINSSGLRTNTGEFRLENKFYVLTASDYQEESWGMEPSWSSFDPAYYYNYFVKWLTEGVGTSGRMPADENNNRQTTLNELYSYIADYGVVPSGSQYIYQHVQVYPANSDYVLFVR